MLPKPEPRKRVKARARRREAALVTDVRARVVLRDGHCRLWVGDPAMRAHVWQIFGKCQGASEWAHLEDGRRFKTRGLPPEERHTTARSCMLCAAHHRTGPHAYDRNRMRISFVTEREADGPLLFDCEEGSYREPEES